MGILRLEWYSMILPMVDPLQFFGGLAMVFGGVASTIFVFEARISRGMRPLSDKLDDLLRRMTAMEARIEEERAKSSSLNLQVELVKQSCEMHHPRRGE